MVSLETPWHWLVLVAALLLIFGPKKLPEMGRSLGKGIREFKDSVTGLSLHSEQESPVAVSAPAEVRDRPASQDRDSIS